MARKRSARRVARQGGRQGVPKMQREPALVAEIGEIVEAYCGTCRLNLDASATALDSGGRVVQVTCRTCGNVQKFRPPMPDEEKRERLLRKVFAIRDRRQQATDISTERRKAYSTSDIMARWRKAAEDADARAPIYRDTDVYEVGDAFIHNRHGLGVVQEVLHDNAALVLFREVEVPLEMGKSVDD